MDGRAIELHPLENNNVLFNHYFNNNLLFYQYCWGSAGSVCEVMMTQINVLLIIRFPVNSHSQGLLSLIPAHQPSLCSGLSCPKQALRFQLPMAGT